MKKNKVKKYIYAIMIVSLIGLILSLAILKLTAVNYLTWNGIRGGLMPDLFESIWHAKSQNPYTYGAIYPPLCYFILDFFNLLIKSEYLTQDRFLDIRYLSVSIEGIKVIALYSIVIFLLSYIMVKEIYNGKNKENVLLTIFFFGSAPFIYMYERGNTVIIAVVAMAVFFSWCSSENKLKRNLALLCFSIAVCLKIYPIIGMLLLIRNKQYKDLIKCTVCLIVIFFLPFVYTGGIKSFFNMMHNIIYLSSETVTDTRGFGFGFKVSLQNIFLAICARYNIDDIRWIPWVIRLQTMALLFSSIVSSKKEYRIICILLIMILIPPFSWIYNVVYLYIPFLMLLKERNIEYFDYCILLLLLLSFIPLPYGFVFRGLEGVNKISLSTLVSTLSMITLSVILEIKIITKYIIENVKIVL